MRSLTISTFSSKRSCVIWMSFLTPSVAARANDPGRCLKPGGILVSLPEPIPESEAAAHGNGSKRGVFFMVRPDREQLSQIATLIDAGAVRPVIAQTVPLAEGREAFERGVAGHTRGKLV